MNSTGSCNSFLSAFQTFAIQPVHANEFVGEMEVVPLVNAAFLAVQVLLQTKIARNCKTVTTGNKLPDFKMTVGNSKIPILLGEDKASRLYQRGVRAKDPVLDLEDKAPWENWEQFYGNIPYYFAYICIGGSASVDLTIGVMDRQSKKFLPVHSNNISNPRQRSEFSIALVKLFPVIKAIADHCQKLNTPVWSVEREFIDMTRKMDTVIVSNVPVFRKEWVYHGLSGTDKAELFYDRIKKVFETLTQESSPNELTFMVPFEPIHKSNHIVKAHFIPFGNRVLIQNEQQLLTCVLTIARAVQHLHSIRIIHNDIRWDNIMEFDGRHFLVDFDDAYCLSNETPSCPPLSHLGADEHCPLSFQAHGGEVDCWAIGRILVTSSFRAISEGTLELSNYCQAVNGTLNSIDNIVEKILFTLTEHTK